MLEVRLERVGKAYGPVHALRDVSVTFSAGKLTTIEGPNGSGKSTLLGLLALLSQPTRGKLFWNNQTDVEPTELRRKIGLLGHSPMLYPELSGEENLEFFGSLYRIAELPQRIAVMRERFGLGDFFLRPTRTYSRGQLQRAALARALLHAPGLLLLDEPLTGLDQASSRGLLEAIADERARGTSIVIVTHMAPELTALADARVRLARGSLAREANA